jgi:hypothetical protein
MARLRPVVALALSALALSACKDTAPTPTAPPAVSTLGSAGSFAARKTGQCFTSIGLPGTQLEVRRNATVLTAPDGRVITRVAIKAGTECYFTAEGATGDVTIDVFGEACYRVDGLGTASVTITRIGDGPACKDISNVGYLTAAAPGSLKICKVAGTGIEIGTTFSFAVGAKTFTVPAGEAAAPICVIAGSFPAGEVTIEETATAGVEVVAIGVAPGGALLSFDLTAGTAVVTITKGLTTEVTFTNRSTVGKLKICKVADTGISIGTNFTFNVGTLTYTIPAGPAPDGYCVITALQQAGTVTIQETPTAGVEVIAISVAPGDALLSFDLTAGTAEVAIAAGLTTEVTFINRAKSP